MRKAGISRTQIRSQKNFAIQMWRKLGESDVTTKCKPYHDTICRCFVKLCRTAFNTQTNNVTKHSFVVYTHFPHRLIGVFRYKKTTPERTSLKELGPCQSHKCHESFLGSEKMAIELRFFYCMMEITNLASYSEMGKCDLVLYSTLQCI